MQTPRVSFYVAATGPHGLKQAAEYGQGWVTYGDPRGPADVPVVVAGQPEKPAAACAERGRDAATLNKVLLQGSTAEKPLQSLDAFVDWAGTYQELGIDEVVLHWPVPDSIFENDLAVFERLATEAPAQLR